MSSVFARLCGFFFFYFALVGVYLIFMPKVLENLGYSAFEIGVIFAMAPLARFFTPFFFLKHIRLTKEVFWASLVTIVVASLLFYLTIYSFWLLLVTNLLLGIAMGLALPYVEPIALFHLQKERYGRSRLFGSIGFMLVALVLAKFMYAPQSALYFLLGTAIFTAIFGFLLSRFDLVEEFTNTTKHDSFSLSRHWPLWVSFFLMQVSFGGFYNFFTIYETAHGLSMEATSYLWSFGVICEIVMLFFQAPLLSRNLYTIIQATVALTVLRWLILYIFPSSVFMTFLSQSLHAFGFALYHTAAISYLYSLYANKKLAQQFFYGISYGLGGFVGAVAAGYFYGKYLFLASSLIAMGAFLTLFWKRK